MNIQEELEALRASESIKHANLQELARLVLAFEAECAEVEVHLPEDVEQAIERYEAAQEAMVNFAKGVAQ